jgi:hypothetical protein
MTKDKPKLGQKNSFSISGEGLCTGTEIIPAGVRFIRQRGKKIHVVLEIPPGVHSIQFEGETFTIAFPYIVFYCLWKDESNPVVPYFRNAPLQSLDDELCEPMLPNCMHGVDWDNHWRFNHYMCGLAAYGESLFAMVDKVKRDFFGAEFNGDGDDLYEYCRFNRGFRKVRSLQEWERNTRRDPSFITKIRWTKSGDTIRNLFDAIPDKKSRSEMPEYIIFEHGKIWRRKSK